MPRFFLHLDIGPERIVDDEGHDFPSQAKAREAAIKSLRDVIAEEVCEGRIDMTMLVQIADRDGNDLTQITFTDAVTLRR